MKKIIKNIVLATFVILVSAGIIGSAAILFARIQESKDRKILSAFVNEDRVLNRLADNQGIAERIACQPAPGGYGKCPALQYKVSPKECLEILHSFEPEKEQCFGGKDVQYKDRNIQIYFGSVYERPGLYIQITMNEKNLFWKFL
jgi:hypothetical protein